jgi:Skp family chaperone for outer membrane proteins
MHSRSTIVCTVIAAAAALAGVGYAIGQTNAQPGSAAAVAPATPTRMAVVDLVRVFNECAMIRDLNSVFTETRRAIQDEAQTRAKVVEDAETKVQAFRPGSPDYDKAVRDAGQKRIQFNVWFETMRAQVKNEEFRWMIEAYNMSNQVISAIATSRGIDMVTLVEPFAPELAEGELQALQAQIRARKVVYNAPTLDITNAVIDDMNRHYQQRGGRATLQSSISAGAGAIPGGAAQPTEGAPSTAQPGAQPTNGPTDGPQP